ncbi:MAG TPA: hypothetical protein VMZ71_06140 [Gemmataceae bacterium]|nr:hypothetical protein [Gemmataceae bacterium]
MAIDVQTQVTDFTITVTVTQTTGGTIVATIGGLSPTRAPINGTPMTPVSGTTNQFTFDVPGPGTYAVTVTCDAESATVNVPVP